MQNPLIISIIMLFVISVLSAKTNKATFSYFEYAGNDVCFTQKINPETQFRNPILPGFYPDPSICRRGNDYFLVNSTFSFFPGIPIFHSRDLVHWKQIGHVLDRPSQLNVDGLGVSEGVFAPAITYNEKTKTFYVINTIVHGMENFIVKSTDPFKGWSEPIALPEVKGIDPSVFIDDDGKAYVVNSDLPLEKPKWRGHRAIKLQEFDQKTDKMVGKRIVLVDGGTDTIKHPKYIEGPHLYKVNGFYYLMAAEGGTSEGHTEVIFRSKNLKGPYQSWDKNPILTQSGLPADRKNKVTSTGHADLVEDGHGNWFAVFLGCRPYQADYYNTGRETFLLPVTWRDGYPVILDKGKEVPSVVDMKSKVVAGRTLSGNYKWRDEFDNPKLDMNWNMVRTPRDNWWSIANGRLELDVLNRSLSQFVNPAFLGRRQQHLNFEASTALNFIPTVENELGGLAYFQNDKNYFVMGKTLKAGKTFVVLQSILEGKNTIIAQKELDQLSLNKELILNMVVKGDEADFYFTIKGEKSILLANKVDVTGLSTKKAGGFVGSHIGPYATSLGY